MYRRNEYKMALRNIVQTGDPVLTKKCRVVTEFNDRLGQLLSDMTQTLIEAEGLGLAAPQVGILRRCVIVAREKEDGEGYEYFEMVNPAITFREGKVELFEGCLSVPGCTGLVVRPEKVRVVAQDRTGKQFTMEAQGMFARAICHELDHLDGRTILETAEYLREDEEDEEGAEA